MEEFASDSSWFGSEDKRTIILVGRNGSGKTATMNSIIDTDPEVFDKMPSPASCLIDTVLDNGQILTVIDTSGEFDISDNPEYYALETSVHAVVLVVSLKTRFSVEESLIIESLMRYFGTKLSEYMIVVFTHGDTLEDMSIDHYLDGQDCPDQLKKTLEMCGNRFAVFDNMTEDKVKKFHQQEEFLHLVDEVVAHNWGIPYTDKFELKEDQWEIIIDQHAEVESFECSSLKSNKACEEQLLEMEPETERLEKQLADEQAARMKAEADAPSTQMKSNEVISKLTEDLKRVQREARKLRNALRETNELLRKLTQEKKDDENLKKNNYAYSLITLAIENQIESKVSRRLENQIAEKFSRMQAEEKEAQRKLNDEIRKLGEAMEKLQRYTDDTFKEIPLKNNYVHMERFHAINKTHLIMGDEEENQKKHKYVRISETTPIAEIYKLTEDLEREKSRKI